MNHSLHKYAITYRCCLVLLLLVMLFTQCAQIVPLSGGEKDVLPPKITRSQPENASVGFTGKEILLEFNEYIQLRDLQNQLIISPKLKEQPDILVRGKSLLLQFKEPLKPSTTYNVNFGNAITDLHEGNVMNACEFVFSTGTILDSLKLSGQLTDAFTLQPATETWMMLYEHTSDSVIYKEKPDYIARTNASGHYEIQHLRAGNYKAFALKDNNRNFLYDAGEQIGYNEAMQIHLEKNDSLNLLLFTENPDRTYIKKTIQPAYGKVQLSFNTPLESINKVIVKNSKRQAVDQLISWSLNKNRDSINIYYRDLYDDTLTAFILYNHSQNDSAHFTAASKQEVERLLSKKRMQLELHPSFSTQLPYPCFKAISFRSNRMLKKIHPEKILLITGKDTLSVREEHIKTTGADSLYINTTLKPDQEYRLMLLQGAIHDILDNTNDTLSYRFKTQTGDYYSSLRIHFKLPENKHWLVQLYNSQGMLAAESRLHSSATAPLQAFWDKLHPDTYSLKLIADANADGKYTPGSYKNKTLPEKVYNNPQSLKIPENWDFEIEWKVE